MRLASQHLVITKRGRTVEPGPGPREHTLKVVLSALWNLSAHCRKNKVKDKNVRIGSTISITYICKISCMPYLDVVLEQNPGVN